MGEGPRRKLMISCANELGGFPIAPQTPFGLHEGISEGFLETFGKNIEKTSKILLTGD